MQNLSSCIRASERQGLDSQSFHSASKPTKSTVSRSRNSKLSHKSRKSTISRISDVAIRKTTLETELEYIDAESKCKAELLKIQTIKKLEVAGAEMQVLEDGLDQSDSKSRIPLALVDKTSFDKDYVEKHSFRSQSPTAIPDNQPLNSPFLTMTLPESQV